MGMGPITIFDKSFLQSLSLDEAVLFDNFFLTNIVPIFFAETMADLRKTPKTGRSPEQEVALIAEKTPQMDAQPNAYHGRLCLADLMGYKVAMEGRIILAQGTPVKSGDKTGVVFEEPPEARAFSRWQDGEFLEVERETAKNWRGMLANLKFNEAIKQLNQFGINPRTCSSLEHAKAIASGIVSRERSVIFFQFALILLGVPKLFWGNIIDRWKQNGAPPLAEFAPYAAYVVILELFFYIGIAAGRISVSGKKVTNRIDLAYLYYLPFCMVFTSSDKFHRSCAPLFLLPNQQFVWGPDLKAELKRLNEYYSGLPESTKQKGLFAIAAQPPVTEGALMTQLWDRFLRPTWRKPGGFTVELEPEKQKELAEHIIRQMDGARPTKPTKENINSDAADFLSLKKRFPMRRGSYWQLPKGLPEDEK
jgi:hypothetical protein